MKEVMVFSIILIFLSIPGAYSEDLFWPQLPQNKREALKAPESSPVKVIKLVLNFYRRSISPNDIIACPFLPSCSKFMEDSINEFGLIGILMGFDRLTRDNPWVGEGYYIFRKGHYLDPPRWHYLPFYWRLNLEKLDLLLNLNE